MDKTVAVNDYLRSNQVSTVVYGNSPVFLTSSNFNQGSAHAMSINLWFVRISFVIDIPKKLHRIWDLRG